MSWPTVAQVVRHERTKMAWAQKDLARLVECSPQYINDIEHGRRHVTAEFASKLEYALRINRGQLIWLAIVEWAGDVLAAEAFLAESTNAAILREKATNARA